MTSNSINLRDYLVAKLPVISTAPSDCRLYEHLIEIGETPKQFANALATLEEGCLPDSPPEKMWEIAVPPAGEKCAGGVMK